MQLNIYYMSALKDRTLKTATDRRYIRVEMFLSRFVCGIPASRLLPDKRPGL
jgi:hypothetical protein